MKTNRSSASLSPQTIYEEALLSRHNLADILLAQPEAEPVRTTLDGFEVSEVGELTLLRIEADQSLAGNILRDEAPSLKSIVAKQTYTAYKSLFELREKYNLGNVVRIWNYIPNIVTHVDEDVVKHDKERYRQFNAGRMLAWDQYGIKEEGGNIFPAATGIGTHLAPIVIEVLFSPFPSIYIDNPIQDPAYNYPKDYGSVSPAFSRATIHLPPDKLQIFISGTGSILNAKTVHVGQVARQARQVMENIKYLISHENLKRYRELIPTNAHHLLDCHMHDLTHLRVYLRHHAYVDSVKSIVDQYLSPEQRVTYERSDFCRTDLSLEMEAVLFTDIPK